MTDGSRQSLTKLAMGGAMAGVGGKIANVVIGIASVAILARLLSPLDYGLFGLVSICLAISQIVPQSISNVIVQRKDATRAELDGAFSFVLVTALSASAVLILFRGQIAGFFSGADISLPLIFAAVLVPFLSVGAYLDGQLSKKFEFKKNAFNDFISTLIGQTVLAIVLAYLGFGVWSLLLGMGAAGLIKLGLQIRAGCWREFRVGRIQLETVRRSGWFLVLNICNYLARNADNIIVGKLLGSEMLGIYQRAFNLMMRPVLVVGGVTTGVLYPLMSSVQDDTARLRSAYLKSMMLTAFLGLPMSLVLYVHGREVIDLLFGSRWGAVVEPFKILVLALFFRLAYRPSDAVLLSIGALRTVTLFQIFYATAVIAGAAIGARWGLSGVATGVALALLSYFILSASFVNRLLDTSIAGFASTHIAGALVAVVAVVPTLLLRDQVAALAGSFGVLAMGGMALAASYGLVLYFHRSLPLDAISRVTLDDLAQRIEKQLAPLLSKMRR